MTRDEFEDYWYSLSDDEKVEYLRKKYESSELQDDEKEMYVIRPPSWSYSGSDLIVSIPSDELSVLSLYIDRGYRILKVQGIELVNSGNFKKFQFE